MALNPNIIICEEGRIKNHLKASERYIHVQLLYPKYIWDGWIPIEYRRTGLNLTTRTEITDHLNYVYSQMSPENIGSWISQQAKFWESKNSEVTKSFFDELSKGGWKCVNCELPQNPNWARRIQDLKEFGYTLATDTSRECLSCGGKRTHIIMLPIERNGNDGNGYEVFSPKLRKRIISTLNSIDVYEDARSAHCLPDHKFPEIRWGSDTKSVNEDAMPISEIQEKFQLITNQRNQQKREVCRNCLQTDLRGFPFGIQYYYKGNENWNQNIPRTGKDAEQGCVGCGWYDLKLWRDSLQSLINKK